MGTVDVGESEAPKRAVGYRLPAALPALRGLADRFRFPLAAGAAARHRHVSNDARNIGITAVTAIGVAPS